MWKHFDPKGAIVGALLLVLLVGLAAALILPAPTKLVTIRVDLPPAQSGSTR
jgi:hypothetical protein